MIDISTDMTQERLEIILQITTENIIYLCTRECSTTAFSNELIMKKENK